MIEEKAYIVAASNDLYVPYLSVMLQSIIEFSSLKHSYEFIIIHTDITEEHIRGLKRMTDCHSNFSMHFFNVSENMKNYKALFISNHIKIETYFRLLLPDLLPDISKVLYIDCDVIANSDVFDLYNINLENYFIAGTADADSAANYNTDKDYKDYIDNVICLSNPYKYLQAGIIVMNLSKFRGECDSRKLLDTALSRKWRFHDQDTLNYLCKNEILFIDYAWNFVYDYNEAYRRSKNVIVNAPHYVFEDYMRAKKNPKMIHFSWVNKPWFSPGVHFGEKFWVIARKTPYYSEMLYKAENDLGNYIENT